MRSKFISNTMFSAASLIVAQALMFFIIPNFVSVFGNQLYGVFVLSNLVTGSYSLLDLGLTQGFIREVTKHIESENKQLLSKTVMTCFLVLLGVGLLVGSLTYLLTPWILGQIGLDDGLEDKARSILNAVSLMSLVLWPAKVFQVVLQAGLHIKENSVIEGLFNVVSSAFILLGVYKSFDIGVIKFISLAIISLSTIFNFILVIKYYGKQVFGLLVLDFTDFWRVFRYSMGVFINKLITFFSVQVDTLIVTKMVGVSYVSYYDMSAFLFKGLTNLQGSLSKAVLPTAYTLDSRSDAKNLSNMFKYGVMIRAGLFYPVFVTAIICCEPFINLWLGGDYAHLVIWSQLFVAVSFFSVFGIINTIALASDKTYLVNRIMVKRVILNVVFSVVFTQWFGYSGVILGTLLSGVIYGDLITAPVIARACNINCRQAYFFLGKLVISILPIGILLYFMTSSLEIHDWISFLGMSTMVACSIYLCVYTFALGQEERSGLNRFFLIGLNKIKA